MSKLYMFSTTHCTKCPEVKKALSEKDIEVTYVDPEETPEFAMRYIVMSVPTILDDREHAEDKYIGQEQCLAFVNTL
ncbi:glutaredoxin family protein [Mammaliicoccus sciuri]|uniref:glutaredoxin family protein n=1 Tax=Mammaliicoccus sciuri TaxID=1296 RepID=UPI00265BA249|nr:thioredoxin family protein [Mammaliicoccus sciuri]MDO0948212.1 thioredoxin family protein [Mammaliicoccus sciuri]MDO0953418.1 thioredoxin family protein [Mammaliicoccus sciuri]